MRSLLYFRDRNYVLNDAVSFGLFSKKFSFMVGNLSQENCDQCQKKHSFSILSRPLTIRIREHKKCRASKILRFLSLFLEKKLVLAFLAMNMLRSPGFFGDFGCVTVVFI